MAKESLKQVSEDFINKKESSDSEAIKTQNDNNIKKKRQNIYLSEKALKLLWQHRIDTGENISRTIERFVLEHLR